MSIAEKLTAVAENTPKVYEAGKKAHYDEFWDSYNTVTVTNFVSLFAGRMWNDTTFKPKYNIVAKGQTNDLFYNSGISNIKQRLIDSGVKLDLSQATQANRTFNYCNSLELPEIDLSNATRVQGTFQEARRLVTIDKVTFKDDVTFQNTFNSIPTLENLTIGGTIGGNGFNVQWSTKLTHDSLMSIINALADKSGDTSGTTWVVTIGTENLAKLTTEEIESAEKKGWWIE